MISKLAKAQESWIFKTIFVAVAISFISLFGVSGYISNASQNQTVVNVNGQKISQSAFSYRLNKEVNAIRNIAGDNFDLTDDMRNTVAESVLKQIIDDAVIDQTMLENSIYFPKVVIQQILFTRPEFQNPQNGQFNPELFRRYLSTMGMSEDEYVAMIKRLLARKMLINDLVAPFKVPSILVDAIYKMDNQRKSFKYVVVSPDSVKIERDITDDEIQQYYTDFSDQFMIAEARDVDVLYIPNEVILNKYVLNEELVKEYFEQHKKELDQPEKREVLQMVFLNEENAKKSFEQVKNNADFNKVAEELGAENKSNPTLGVVAYDELAEGLADEAFNLPVNEPKIVQVADSWQVILVKEIIPAKEANFEESKKDIEKILSDENLYDAIREARADIDDTVSAGKSLAEVANIFGLDLIELKNINEEIVIKDAPESINQLASNLDFNEIVYSYGLNEISSAEEFDNGLVVLEVKNIVDAHMPEIDDIRDEIIALWNIQEKNAIAKEIAENIMVDVEEDGDIVNVAKARGLEVFRSEPISRNETFAGLSAYDINDLFITEENKVKIYEKPGNNFVIAVLLETINFQYDSIDDENKKEVTTRAENSMTTDMLQSMLKSYAQDLKIEVDYKRAGFSE